VDYFASDFHLGHNKPFIYEKRGFSSIEEHDTSILSEVSKLTAKDTLYYLGDFTFKSKVEDILKYYEFFKCKVVFITGNHDKYILQNKKYFDRFIFVDSLFNYKYNRNLIVLCHYPMRNWDRSHYNSWHLFGHIHDKTDFGGKTLNITIDNIGKFILSYNDIEEYMKSRPNNYNFIEKE